MMEWIRIKCFYENFKIFSHFPSIDILVINNTIVSGELQDLSISDSAIIEFAQSCPKITRLDVTCMNNITDESMKALAQGCPLFEFVDFVSCFEITNIGISMLAENCRNLTYQTQVSTMTAL
jgi:hypothetical protein